MTVTVSILAERALRRLGVAVVPASQRPPLFVTIPAATIATGALIELGVIATNEVPSSQATVVPVDSIATTALIKLGVIASDESPSATDLALSRDAVNAVHDALVAQGSVDWTSAQISTAVAEEYAGLTAAVMASSFGKQGEPAIVPLLEGRIAQASRVQRAHALAVSKVNAVHDALVAQGFVQWFVDAIPQAVAEEYTKLTALIMATSFGKTMGDAQMHALLEARAKRVATVMRAPEIAEAAVMAVHNDLVMRGRARWSSQDIPDSLAQPYVMLAAAACSPEFDAKTDPLEIQIAERMISRYIALPTSGERVYAEYF